MDDIGSSLVTHCHEHRIHRLLEAYSVGVLVCLEMVGNCILQLSQQLIFDSVQQGRPTCLPHLPQPLYHIRRDEGHRVVESRDPSKPGLRGTSELGVVTKTVRGSEGSRMA